MDIVTVVICVLVAVGVFFMGYAVASIVAVNSGGDEIELRGAMFMDRCDELIDRCDQELDRVQLTDQGKQVITED